MNFRLLYLAMFAATAVATPTDVGLMKRQDNCITCAWIVECVPSCGEGCGTCTTETTCCNDCGGVSELIANLTRSMMIIDD